MTRPSYQELRISQIPALQLLMALGYEYLTPDEALALRGGKKSAVVLSDVLADWLRANNAIVYKGDEYAFSEANISEALRRLTDVPYDGLISTSARVLRSAHAGHCAGATHRRRPAQLQPALCRLAETRRTTCSTSPRSSPSSDAAATRRAARM